MTATPGQVALRRFDHDEAQARYAAGDSIAELARVYGVSSTAVARVVDERVRAKMHAASAAALERRREPCRGGCGTLVWAHTARRTGYCRSCLAAKRREVINHGTEYEYKAGCRCYACTKAASDAKARRRAKTRVPCSHGCGRMVDSINRRDSGKPYECQPCSLARIKAGALR